MHSDEVLVEAIQLRLKGTPVKEVASKLGVSVGWASENLSGIRPRLVRDRSMLVATDEALQADEQNWGRRRKINADAMDDRKFAQRRETITAIREASNDFSVLPGTNTKAYERLDRLQQLFAKDPGRGVFAITKMEAPKLHSHMVAWRTSKHGCSQDKSDERFARLAEAVRDHVLERMAPPSCASPVEAERAAARWLSRWLSNARGRGERRRNIERAALFIEIGTIVDALRAGNEKQWSKARAAVQNGQWKRLFDELLATRNSYAYEDVSATEAGRARKGR